MQASPGSAEGNSVLDRKQITSDDGPAPAKRGLFGFLSNKNEVASVGENPVEEATEKVEEAVEAAEKPVEAAVEKVDQAVKKIPSPDGLIEAPTQAQVWTWSFYWIVIIPHSRFLSFLCLSSSISLVPMRSLTRWSSKVREL